MPKEQTLDDATSFEDALGQLESLVETLEGGDIPLADLVTNYEKGTRLATFCQTKLNQAEQKIEQLKQAGDELDLEPFDDAGEG